MNKKIIVIVSIILVVLIALGLYFVLTNNSDNSQTNEPNNSQTNEQNGSQDVEEEITVPPNSSIGSTSSDSVVVYFSATGNTERVQVILKR